MTIRPTFYNKNHLNNVSQVTDNTGGATDDKIKFRLLDRDIDVQYRTVGLDTGDRIVTLDFGSPVLVDRIWIQNHNMQDFKIEYDGPIVFSVTDGGPTSPLNLTGNIATDSYFEVSQVNTQTVIVTCTNTTGGTPGELRIGEIYVGGVRFSVGEEAGGDLDIQPGSSQSIITLSDETIQKLFVRRTINHRLSLVNVPRVEIQDYLALYSLNRRNSFAFAPRPAITHPDFAPDNIWDGIGAHYNWINDLDIYNFTDPTGNTFDVNINLAQAGGFD